MTIPEMIETLIDKGHTSQYAKYWAEADYADLKLQDRRPVSEHDRDCSVCRGRFTELEMKYHYHPCE